MPQTENVFCKCKNWLTGQKTRQMKTIKKEGNKNVKCSQDDENKRLQFQMWKNEEKKNKNKIPLRYLL